MSKLQVETISHTNNTSALTIDSSGNVTAPVSIGNVGSVVNFSYRNVESNGFTTTSSSYTDVTGDTTAREWYVDITPKFNDSIIVFETTMIIRVTDTAAYYRFRVVDSNNSDNVLTGTSIAAGNYQVASDIHNDQPIRAAFVSGTTNAMRLQLQVLTTGGTFNATWSSSDIRAITATEFKQ